MDNYGPQWNAPMVTALCLDVSATHFCHMENVAEQFRKGSNEATWSMGKRTIAILNAVNPHSANATSKAHRCTRAL